MRGHPAPPALRQPRPNRDIPIRDSQAKGKTIGPDGCRSSPSAPLAPWQIEPILLIDRQHGMFRATPSRARAPVLSRIWCRTFSAQMEHFGIFSAGLPAPSHFSRFVPLLSRCSQSLLTISEQELKPQDFLDLVEGQVLRAAAAIRHIQGSDAPNFPCQRATRLSPCAILDGAPTASIREGRAAGSRALASAATKSPRNNRTQNHGHARF
jgi:hypothetical protein